MLVPFARPSITGAECAAVQAVMRSGWLTSGPVTARLEDMAKEITGARNCIAVNSAATGLMLALRYQREQIKGVDYTLNVPAIGGHFAASAAIMAGVCPDQLRAVECEDDLTVTADVTCVGLEYGGRVVSDGFDHQGLVDAAYGLTPIGQAWAKVSSLQATKSITSGEGGCVYTNDDDFAAWLKEARSHGMQASSHERGEGDYQIEVPGGGFLLPDILSAVAVSQMQRAGEMRARRVQIAMDYDKALAPSVLAGRVIPVERDYDKDALGLFALRIPHPSDDMPEGPMKDITNLKECWLTGRNAFRKEMAARDVSTRNHYRAIWEHPAYEFLREQGERDAPLAARVSREVVTLPLFSAMTDEECAAVCAALIEVLGG